MTKVQKFNLANDCDFMDAILDAQDGKPPMQTRPFVTIGDRIRLIAALEEKGFKISRVKKQTKEAKGEK